VAAADIPVQNLLFKYRLLPTRRQHEALEKIREDQRVLYNAALQERIDSYQKVGVYISLYDQQKSLTIIRRECEGWGEYPAVLQRGTLRRLHKSFEAFFRRVKRGEARAGFPRFKAVASFKSFTFAEWSGITLRNNRIHFKGLPGSLRVHMHRPLPSDDIRSAIFKRDAKGWHVCLAVRVPVVAARVPKRSIGIDMGITTLATLSTGEAIPNPRQARKALREERRLRRALQRCERGRKRHVKTKIRLERFHARVAGTRRTYLHQVSARLVREYDIIAGEKLNMKALAASMLAREVRDAGWGMLTKMLRYKAERAGAQLVEVDCRYTSQDCSACGERVKKTLKERTHCCPSCGLVLDRDLNAARNILQRAGSAARAA
jgi:putative transposase